MTPEQWQKVFAVVKACQEQPEGSQASFLAEACGGEREVVEAAQSLISVQQRMGSFLEEPVRPERFSTQGRWSRTLDLSVANRDGDTAKPIAPKAEAPDALPRGAVVGRYVVLNLLGMGGMGVVYAAYDPELGRKLAIKLLHPEASKALLGSDGRARLLREAQAMARLAHPNVIAVHDVGTFGDEVFIAMEYVDGYTLKGWLEAQRREWPEIIAMFVQAGHGLSAAHSAGIVHRDFKPENVLVGKDGRARVVDFGLARGTLIENQPDGILASIDGQSTHSIGPNASAYTRTLPGTLLGTPAYMAPEQIAGGEVDARTDQFSFCASLFQALNGELPFKGATLQQRLAAIRAGAVNQPKASGARSPAPAWLRQAVLKGLNAQPAHRYGSMELLLHELQKKPGKVWRPLTVSFAIVLLVLLAAGGSYRLLTYRQKQVCRGVEEKLAGIWDVSRKGAIRQAFLATTHPNALQIFTGMEQVLDRQAQTWVGMRTAACQARLRGDESEALVDLRIGCLQNRLEEMRRLTDRFVQADAQLVDRSVEAANSLSPLRVCEDAVALTAQQPETSSSSSSLPPKAELNAQPVGDAVEPPKAGESAPEPAKYPPTEQPTNAKRKTPPRVPPQKRVIEIE